MAAERWVPYTQPAVPSFPRRVPVGRRAPMPDHDEELKRFRKNPREVPDKKFSDAFKFFARKVDLKEDINNPKATESEQNRSKDPYIELIENDSKSLEKKNLELRSRVSSLSDGTPLTKAHRIKGGKAPKDYRGVQEFINRLFDELAGDRPSLTLGQLESWLTENAPREEGYDPDPTIPDFDDVEYYDKKLWWKNDEGRPLSLTKRALEQYITRAKSRDRSSHS